MIAKRYYFPLTSFSCFYNVECQISVENMLECLKTMGLHRLSKEQYFSDIVVGGGYEEDLSEEMSVDEDSVASGEQSIFGSEKDTSVLESLPAHSTPSDSSLPPHHSYLSNLIYLDSFFDDILSSDVDEAEFTKELAEEDILDVLDVMKSQEHEKTLWKTHR